MNSHRDNVKSAIAEFLNGVASSFIGITEEQVPEASAEVADTVFDALGITEDEQDKCGGYFMLHAEKGERQFIAPKTTRQDWPEEVNEYTIRTKELTEGAKYTAEEFKSYAVGRVTGGTPCNWYINLQTPIAGYSQMYSGTYTLKEAKSVFVDYYYPMYLADYERSKGVDKMDKE